MKTQLTITQHPVDEANLVAERQMSESMGAVVVFHDACQSLTRSAQFAYQAQYDALTSLPNRFLFAERLSRAIGLAKRHRHQVVDVIEVAHEEEDVGWVITKGDVVHDAGWFLMDWSKAPPGSCLLGS